eukprot:4863370-Amphidinium_carterae.1
MAHLGHCLWGQEICLLRLSAHSDSGLRSMGTLSDTASRVSSRVERAGGANSWAILNLGRRIWHKAAGDEVWWLIPSHCRASAASCQNNPGHVG